MAHSLRVFWKHHFQGEYQHHIFKFASVHATDTDITFYEGAGTHTVKVAKQVYNSMWIALVNMDLCWLKHGC